MADGTIEDINATNYPDLFWALCGAGANSFGIVIGFTFQMYFIPEVSYVSLTWPWNPSLAAQVLIAWQAWIPTLPETITSECNFTYLAGASQVSVSILKVGSEPLTEWQAVFSNFAPAININYQGTYLGAATLFASNYTQPFSKVKSKILFEPLSVAGIQVLNNFFGQLQENPCNIRVNFEFGSGVGGAISQPNPSSSYFPRNAFGWFFQFIYWTYEYQATYVLNLLQQFYLNMEPYTSQYSYANLIDYEIGASYLNAYYGTNVNSLIQVKNIYDPTNIFNWKQGIPLQNIAQSTLNQLIQKKYCSC